MTDQEQVFHKRKYEFGIDKISANLIYSNFKGSIFVAIHTSKLKCEDMFT